LPGPCFSPVDAQRGLTVETAGITCATGLIFIERTSLQSIALDFLTNKENLEQSIEPSSPRRLSNALDEPLSRIAYHVKILLETGLIELADTRPVRGSVEHIYRPVYPLILPEGLWAALPKSARQKIYADVLVDIDNDVTSSVQAGTFDARSDSRELDAPAPR
jgi:hypothetical protein